MQLLSKEFVSSSSSVDVFCFLRKKNIYFYFPFQNCNPNFEVCCTVQSAPATQTQRPIVPSTYRPTQAPQTYRPTQAPQTYRPTQAPQTYRPTQAPQTYRPTQPPQTYRPTQPPQTYRPNPSTQAPTYSPQNTQTAYLPPVIQQEQTSRPQPPPTYRPAPPQTQRPTPPPTQRPTPPPSTPCQQNGYVCVSPNLCRSGAITASAVPQSSSVSTEKKINSFIAQTKLPSFYHSPQT
jgi:hypothetical protein